MPSPRLHQRPTGLSCPTPLLPFRQTLENNGWTPSPTGPAALQGTAALLDLTACGSSSSCLIPNEVGLRRVPVAYPRPDTVLFHRPARFELEPLVNLEQAVIAISVP
jgi:hypothetical protein